MISLLASVRNLIEAQEAAAAGADLIDLKEPSAGALGGLKPQEIGDIVTAIRRGWPQRPVSATIGDFSADDHAGRRAQVAAVARCGVDYVKAGIEPGEHAMAALRSLAQLRLPSIVIVFLADRGVDLPLVTEAATMGFAGLMVDTGDKSAGSLLQHADPQALRALIAVARRHGCLSGLAGSLRRDDVGSLRQLAPDFAGFRGAVCDVDRRGRLNPRKLRELRAALRGEDGSEAGSEGGSELASQEGSEVDCDLPQHAAASPVAGCASSSRIRGSSALPSNSIE
jgi:uncharacterized protein (UPF0264 family)